MADLPCLKQLTSHVGDTTVPGPAAVLQAVDVNAAHVEERDDFARSMKRARTLGAAPPEALAEAQVEHAKAVIVYGKLLGFNDQGRLDRIDASLQALRAEVANHSARASNGHARKGDDLLEPLQLTAAVANHGIGAVPDISLFPMDVAELLALTAPRLQELATFYGKLQWRGANVMEQLKAFAHFLGVRKVV